MYNSKIKNELKLTRSKLAGTPCISLFPIFPFQWGIQLLLCTWTFHYLNMNEIWYSHSHHSKAWAFIRFSIKLDTFHLYSQDSKTCMCHKFTRFRRSKRRLTVFGFVLIEPPETVTTVDEWTVERKNAHGRYLYAHPREARFHFSCFDGCEDAQ